MIAFDKYPESRLELFYRLAVLALLCTLAYSLTVSLPLFEDDYPYLSLVPSYGPPSAIPALLSHPVYRLRATTIWSIYLLWKLFGFRPWAYHAASLALHILNTWLVFAIGRAWPRMRPASFWAAAFFAVAEGHQEAVIWLSAISELWMFLFGGLALWCWLQDRRWGVVPFALALISKESAVIFLPLFFLTARRDWRRWLPYLALAAVVTSSVFANQSGSFRFSDGSFSLHAPFRLTWPRGIARVLWIWGWIAAAAIWFLAEERSKRTALIALLWIAIALLPYSFLTYSAEMPSRHTYLASVGLAYLVGLAMTVLPDRRLLAAAAALMLVHNVGYISIKKRAQFLERAAPTEQLIAMARSTSQPIWVRCFPRAGWIAEEAVRFAASRQPSGLVWSEAEARARDAADFCYAPSGLHHK